MAKPQRKNMEDQFADWTAQWEKAQQDGTFADAPQPAQPRHQSTSDFFGQYPSPQAKSAHASDVEYWRQVYALSNGAGDAPDVTNHDISDGDDHFITDNKKNKGKPINEQKAVKKEANEFGPGFRPVENNPRTKPAPAPGTPARQKELGLRASQAARSPNPIYFYSTGKDQEPHVTPNWAGGEQVERVIELRQQLHELEGKINGLEGTGKTNNKALEAKVNELRTRLDNLSDQLAPDMLDDPLS